jgi:hypothetical protein
MFPLLDNKKTKKWNKNIFAKTLHKKRSTMFNEYMKHQGTLAKIEMKFKAIAR